MSEESDDEPLSVIAANKKLYPDKYPDTLPKSLSAAPKKKKKKNPPPKRLSVTIKLNKKSEPPPVIERPADVWLYLKDLNPTGPYSCLLCSEWFINRAKMIVHYILNHKKDFCGICRYFVPDRESWWKHVKFHSPWPCSQCVLNFDTEAELRVHLKEVHSLVHCRLCHFRVAEGDPYNTHLFQKHNVTNMLCREDDSMWELEFDLGSNFMCLLCSKSNSSRVFFNHFMGYHHFTLKCFTSLVSGKELPFVVYGADIRSEFVEMQLKNHSRYGYVDLSDKPPESIEYGHSIEDTKELLSVLIPEIKQETMSGDEGKDDDEDKLKDDELDDILKTYNGDDDFDITLTELIILQQTYVDYVKKLLNDIELNFVHEVSEIESEKLPELVNPITCSFCQSPYNDVPSFVTHMYRMHSLKASPLFSCRVCATSFENKNDLTTHIAQELGEFEDLWICQFCDKEFDNREQTRKHLTEHWQLLEFDNCFSPHLGFKCRHCPTLFWHETDRENHQLRVHFLKYKDQYYKCEKCDEVFSDKVWFTHHYLDKHITEKVPLYLLKCSLCCLVLPDIDDMRVHFNAEHPEARKLYCSLDSCKYRPLSHRKSFKLHLRSVHNPRSRVTRSVACGVCGREFSGARACTVHVAQSHGPGKFKCKLCKEMLHTQDERKLHYLITHPGQHPFECSECGKSFQYKSSLYMHKQEHQPNKQIYTCTVCGKTFLKRDSFREHEQIHSGPRHACSYCPMRFVQRSNMLRHERRHTGERPYACPHCPRTFADKGACNSHSRTHSRDTSYACMYCGKTFVQKSKLTYHIRKHTGENLETCPVCSKLFTSACSLREHMKTHTAKKAIVKCPLCERVYQDERYMLRHLRTAHSRARFPCPLCDKVMTSAASLRHHVITHTSLKTFRCKMCPKSSAVKRTMVKHFRRRHGFKGNEPNIKEFYTRLEPRECNLGLSEQIMTNIFGPPPKKRQNDVVVADYVTLANQVLAQQLLQKRKESKESKEEQKKVETDSEDSKDTNEESETVQETKCIRIDIKEEAMSDSDRGEDLEPTDFVSVKIESMDDDESQYNET